MRRFESCWGASGSPTELPVLYRQNSGGGLFFVMAPGSDTGRLLGGLAGKRWRRCPGVAGWAGAWLIWRGEDDEGDRWCWWLSAVGEVVAQAGPAPSCALGDAGFIAGGQVAPGADLADVRGHEQQRGEDGLCGDAADAAAGGLSEGLVGGVFDVAVEAFDGVAQRGVGVVPGR